MGGEQRGDGEGRVEKGSLQQTSILQRIVPSIDSKPNFSGKENKMKKMFGWVACAKMFNQVCV